MTEKATATGACPNPERPKLDQVGKLVTGIVDLMPDLLGTADLAVARGKEFQVSDPSRSEGA